MVGAAGAVLDGPLSGIATHSSGRATSHGSERRSQLSGRSRCQPSSIVLPEHPVLVAEAVADGGKLQRRHRVEEAGREPPEAAVAEPGVGLQLEEADPVEPFPATTPGDRVEQQVHDVVGERAADQELHRQVVDALGVLALVRLLGADHRCDRTSRTERATASKRSRGPGGRGIADAVEQQMALVEPIGSARELDGAAAILREQIRRRGRDARRQVGRTVHMLVPVLRGSFTRRHHAPPSCQRPVDSREGALVNLNAHPALGCERQRVIARRSNPRRYAPPSAPGQQPV